MNYRTFTSNLALYRQHVKSLEEARSKLDLILYDMGGVKGVTFDNIPGTPNPLQNELKRLQMIEKYNEQLNEVKYYETAIKSVDEIRKRLPIELWDMLYEKFVLEMTYKSIGIKHGYSDYGIWNYMKRETERYL